MLRAGEAGPAPAAWRGALLGEAAALGSDLRPVDARDARRFRSAREIHSNELPVTHNVQMVGALALVTAAAAITFPHGTAVITTTPTHTVTVRIEIARTDPQRHQGLMGRDTLAPRAGMAFLWTGEVRGTFWMKNTTIPLSIAFWDRRGRILKILDMSPCLRDPCRVYDPKVPFSGALEVNRGAFRRWGAHPGSAIRIRG